MYLIPFTTFLFNFVKKIQSDIYVLYTMHIYLKHLNNIKFNSESD